MRILVVGSCRSSVPGATSEEIPNAEVLRTAAREIGGELASRGHTVIVGSDDQSDVDPYVVEGAVKAGAKQIEVHVPHGSAEPYVGTPQVSTKWHQFPNWDVTVAEVVRDRVDAVIALGGRLGVVQAGLSAWMLERPVIAVAGFGGGAKTVWEYSSGRRPHFYRNAIDDAQIDRLAGPWGTAGSGPNAAFVVSAVEAVSKATAIARMSQGLLAWVAALAILALGTWLYSVVDPVINGEIDGDIGLEHLFLSVASAGVLGTTLNTLRLMRSGTIIRGRTVAIDLVLGLIAGVISAALYIIAQIALSGGVSLKFEPEDFLRVALIVSTVSLFAATYLDKAFARFDEASEQVIRGEFGNKKRE